MPQWYITAVNFTMKKYLFILSAIVLFAFSGCQKSAGDPVSQNYAVESAYTTLEVQDAFDVVVDEEATEITITVGERVLPYVVVKVVDNTLKIYLNTKDFFYGGEQKAIIPYNANLKQVILSGASEFRSQYGLEGEKVEVELSGASDFYCGIVADETDMNLSGASSIEGNVTASELDLELSGASDATLMGQVDKLDIGLSGASDIKKTVDGARYGLVCDQCEGTMSGSSNAYIHCDGRICVDLSGSSTLHYTGDGSSSGCSTTSGGSTISGPEHP